jgi:hypothetical protein
MLLRNNLFFAEFPALRLFCFNPDFPSAAHEWDREEQKWFYLATHRLAVIVIALR